MPICVGLYNKVADDIERKGGRVLRVTLDYELKEKLYRKLGEAQARNEARLDLQKQILARELELPIIEGKVVLPDKIGCTQFPGTCCVIRVQRGSASREQRIRAAQDILGQSDVDTTLRVNTHSVPESKRRAVANVAALLFPSVPPQEGQQEQRQESIN